MRTSLKTSKFHSKMSLYSSVAVGMLLLSLVSSPSLAGASSGWVLSKESAGNYVAASTDGKKIVVATGTGWVGGGRLQTSIDYGASWTTRDTYRYWTDVASSNDGTHLAATVQGGGVYISTDSGASWKSHGPLLPWTSVAMSSDGAKLVATVNPGQIFTSTDFGSTWTPRGDDQQWASVASSSNGNILVAVAHFDHIYTSNDAGETWVAQDEVRLWNSVTASSDGSKMAAVVYADPGNIYISSDSGDTWVLRAPELNKHWQGVAMSSDGRYLIAGAYNANVYSSNDFGVSWFQDSPATSAEQVAISADGSRKLVTSPLGIYTFGMPDTLIQKPISYKASLKIKKVSDSQYTLTVTSNGPNAKYTITAKKKANTTYTFTGLTNSSGGATVSIKMNLVGYSFYVAVST